MDDFERDEDFDNMTAALNRRAKLGKYALFAFFCLPLLPISMCSYRWFGADLLADKYSLDASQVEAIEAAQVEAQKRADRMAERFAHAFDTPVVPRPDLGRCDQRLGVRHKRTKKGWQSRIHNRQFPWTKITRGAPWPKSQMASSLRAKAAGPVPLDREWRNPQGPEGYTRGWEQLRPWREYEVVVITDIDEPPALAYDSFISGKLEGTAYLYSHNAGRIVCAGHVSAKSSSSVDFKYYSSGWNDGNRLGAARHAMDEDWQIEIERAIAFGVKSLAGTSTSSL